MFEKFGEFDSYKEINRAAAAQLEEGDTEAIIAIAEENGIDKEDAEDYIDGIVDELCNTLMAAMGKLKVETKELELFGELEFYKTMVEQECNEDSEFALAVRKKGKSLVNCMGRLLKAASNNRKKVPEQIAKAAGIPTGIYTGSLNKTEAVEIIRNYYMKG